MPEMFSNKASTTLNGAITATDTTLVVASATAFPSSGNFRIIVKAEGANTDEIMTVTAVSSTTFTISRATEPTGGSQVSSAHGNGAVVAHVLTEGAVKTIQLAQPQGPIIRVIEVASSPYTWVKSANLHYIRVKCQGGGGAGGGAATTAANQGAEGGGGGAGGYAEKVFHVEELTAASYTLTVGAGGTVGTAGANPGNNGNDTTFAGTGITTVNGSGGTGGTGMAAGASGTVSGGESGASSGGDLNIRGDDGRNGKVYATGSPSSHADGGRSTLGSSQRESSTTTGSAGLTGQLYGGGGSGGVNFASQAAARTGGAGADGVGIIEEYYYDIPPAQGYAQARAKIA